MSTLAFDAAGAAMPSVGSLEQPVQNARLAWSAGLHLECIRTRSGFDALEPEWNALFERAGSDTQVFQQFNWLWHWANHFTDERTEFAIVVGRRAGRLLVVWPLVIERPLRLRQLAWMGDPVSQYGDALVDDVPDQEAVLLQSWHFALAQTRPDLVRLAKVRADAASAQVIAAGQFKTVAREAAPFSSLQSCRTYRDLEARLPMKQRKNRRRQQRRFEERGPLDIETWVGSERAADAVRLGLTLKRAWLNERGLVSRAFADPRLDRFFTDAARGLGRPCGVSVSLLSRHGEAANVSISIDCKGRRALHVIAYALKFQQAGVGGLHLEADLQRAFADGIAVFDFLAPNHDYKREWSDGAVAVEDHAQANTLAGTLYAEIYLAWLRETAKTALKTLPAGLIRAFARAHRSTPA